MEKKSGNKRERTMEEEGEEDNMGQPPSHIASHGGRVKERYTEVRKRKSQEAKDRWVNLS